MFTVQFAQKAIVFNGNYILMVRRCAPGSLAGFWEIPGGRLEMGEELDASLEREVFEETGIAVLCGEPMHVWQWVIPSLQLADPSTGATVVTTARVCGYLGGKISDANRAPDDNIDRAEWVPIEDMPTLQIIPNMLPLVGQIMDIARRLKLIPNEP